MRKLFDFSKLLEGSSMNAVKLEYASRIADQRAALVKGAGTLVPIIADLQRLCNILNREK